MRRVQRRYNIDWPHKVSYYHTSHFNLPSLDEQEPLAAEGWLGDREGGGGKLPQSTAKWYPGYRKAQRMWTSGFFSLVPEVLRAYS